MKVIYRHRIQKLRKYKWLMGFGFIALVLWYTCLPEPLFTEKRSTVVESEDGRLLGARIAEDGQWRFPSADQIPEKFETCLLLFEDEYFYQHPGFNPVSISKALWYNLTHKNRIGGSTLTQQVIRLSRKKNERTYFEKIIEIAMATRAEAKFSKKEILNLYAANAPFGGNVVGLEAASWRYFRTAPEFLSWSQAAALAVLPNAPSAVYPGKSDRTLERKRNALLQKLHQRGHIDETTLHLALEEPLPGVPYSLPDMALHFTQFIQKEKSGNKVRSSLNFELQQKANEIIQAHHQRLSKNQIQNAALLVLDVNSKKVLAYVGNTPTAAVNGKYVDIIQSKRSTGSILKPFLFTAALEDGLILPGSLLADVPTVVNGYSPKNFDLNYYGAVPARQALSRSLNVPSVRLLKDFGLQRFYNKLKKASFHSIRNSPEHYGLTLILGGAEASLWEVTNAYASLAGTVNFYTENSSQYNPQGYALPIYKKQDQGSRDYVFKPEVFGAGPSFLTLEALREVNRPEGQENWSFFSESQPIAWKTGTSYGFKDAWAVGVTPRYAIGVWVGNADGEGRPGLTGISAAAPLLFDMLAALPQSGWFETPYDDLITGQVCVQSGQLKGKFCDQWKEELIPERGGYAANCQYHIPVNLDATENYRVDSDCYPLNEMKHKNWFVLPPVMTHYYVKQHPEYTPLPEFLTTCNTTDQPLLQFIFPRSGDVVLLPKTTEGKTGGVIFSIAHRNPEAQVFWYLNNEWIGKTATFHELEVNPTPGEHLVTAVDQNGNSIQARVTIKNASERTR